MSYCIFIALTRCHMYDRTCEVKDLFVRIKTLHFKYIFLCNKTVFSLN